MEYVIGKTAGFCFGVRNAVESAEKSIEKNNSMCCLGEIVHNKEVISELESKGMRFIENLDENEEKLVTIIRAHGVSKKIYNQANEKGIELVDLTCPYVLKIHKMVEEHAGNGDFIFLVGAKEHPETIGTAGFCGNNYHVIENFEDIDTAINEYTSSNCKKIFIAVQTTYNLEKFNKISEQIKQYFNNKNSEDIVEIANTICLATKERQEETANLSKDVDAMIIIGGKNSSNTKKLFEIAKENCSNTICVETYKDIDTAIFKDVNKVGIMAGASTPKSSINRVVMMIENL